MNRQTHAARWIFGGVSVLALAGAGSALATTEPPDTTTATADTSMSTEDMTAGSAAGTGAGPSDCPAITEGAEATAAEGTEAAGTEAMATEAAGTEAMATETTGAMDTMATETTGAMDTMATTGDSAVVDVSAAPMAGPIVQIAETDEYGPILVDGNCMALYGFTPDTEGEPTCVGDCAVNWPPLLVEGTEVPPLADELDPSLFSVVEHPEQGSMLKVGDWPLYYFAGDAAPGDLNGQGVGGVWWLVSPDGTLFEEAEEGAEGSEAAAGSEAAEATEAAGTEAATATTEG